MLTSPLMATSDCAYRKTPSLRVYQKPDYYSRLRFSTRAVRTTRVLVLTQSCCKTIAAKPQTLKGRRHGGALQYSGFPVTTWHQSRQVTAENKRERQRHVAAAVTHYGARHGQCVIVVVREQHSGHGQARHRSMQVFGRTCFILQRQAHTLHR